MKEIKTWEGEIETVNKEEKGRDNKGKEINWDLVKWSLTLIYLKIKTSNQKKIKKISLMAFIDMYIYHYW